MLTVTPKTDISFEGEFHDDANRVSVKLEGAAPGITLDDGDTFVIPLTQLRRVGGGCGSGCNLPDGEFSPTDGAPSA
jgi:hypothetical protein